MIVAERTQSRVGGLDWLRGFVLGHGGLNWTWGLYYLSPPRRLIFWLTSHYFPDRLIFTTFSNKTLTSFQFLLLVVAYLTPPGVITIGIALLSVQSYDQLTAYIGDDDPQCLRRVPYFDRRLVTEE
uniref:Transmembrane protein n=1 Tax=Bursaphelenchus xylophilus TaxID=6326 RepID=A0A1I7SPQ1_BURXY